MDDWMAFTAKWDDAGGSHPLIYHLIDSGCVAAALWGHGLTEGARQEMAAWMNLDEAESGQLIAFWTALHDLGKATPSFQARADQARSALQAAGFEFSPVGTALHHSILSAWTLEKHLDALNLTPSLAGKKLLLALGGHHGTFPTFQQFNKTAARDANLGDQRWETSRDQLFTRLRQLFRPAGPARLAQGRATANAFFDVLTGLFITADWLASNTDFFPYHTPDLSPETYFEQVAKPKALEALQRSGWIGWQPESVPRGFMEAFPNITQANPLQQTALGLLNTLGDPFLMIVEAPTGSGKTEIALYAAGEWMRQNKLRGCYVAMPTQATSNQMFTRVRDYLERQFPSQPIHVKLVHGNALLNAEQAETRLAGIADNDADPNDSANAMSWFDARKRTLLAPFGVGTVDQTFLSVIHVRHFSLRQFGLFRKVIIFDEVHAYDVYMVELFKRLLAWLRAIGSSVIILSATLPRQTREELLRVFDPRSRAGEMQAEFPRLSLNTAGRIRTLNLGATPSRTIHVREIDRAPESLRNLLRTELIEGGCAAVMCNTVQRAQEIYHFFHECGDFDADELLLFHAHFPYCWREQREHQVVERYARLKEPGGKPRRGIVIATQVIEQSLDLDFDLLVSDLAPVDLLIQRIGRLQRHSGMKNAPARPPRLKEALCAISLPETNALGLLKCGSDAWIYDEVFLQRTYFTIHGKDQLLLPAETDALLAAVYSDEDLPGLSAAQNAALHKLYTDMKRKAEEKAASAQNRLVADVDWDDALGNSQVDYVEDDPSAHPALQALTRDARPSVQVVCALADAQGQPRLLEGGQAISTERCPAGAELQAAQRSTANLSDPRVVDYFRSQPAPSAWRKSAQLRHAFLAVFKAGICPLDNPLQLRLDKDLGILVENR